MSKILSFFLIVFYKNLDIITKASTKYMQKKTEKLVINRVVI